MRNFDPKTGEFLVAWYGVITQLEPVILPAMVACILVCPAPHAILFQSPSIA